MTDGRTFTRIGPVTLPARYNHAASGESRYGIIQPSVIALGGRHLRFYARPTLHVARVCVSDSFDAGRSWSAARPIGVPNPNSGIDTVALPDGRIVLAYDDSTCARTPLVPAVSRDGLHVIASPHLHPGRMNTRIRRLSSDPVRGSTLRIHGGAGASPSRAFRYAKFPWCRTAPSSSHARTRTQRAMHMHRRDFVIAAAAFAALPLRARAEEQAGPHVHGLNGVTIPPNRPVSLKLRVLDGPDFLLESQRGKVVIVNFFATWCPPCRREAPAFCAFAAAHPDDTCVVSVNYRETDDTVRAWRKTYAIDYRLGMDQTGGFYANLGLKVFPSTLIFRPDGAISCLRADAMHLDELEEERAFALDNTPSESSPAPASTPR